MAMSNGVALGITCVLGAILIAISVDSCDSSSTPTPSAQPTPAPKSLPAVSRECVISADGDDAMVFPTEAGLDAFRAAAKSGAAIASTAMRHGGFTVTAGTSCEYVDRGFGQSQVLITAGPHLGRTGWLPTPWTRR